MKSVPSMPASPQAQPLPADKSSRQITAALKEAYRIHRRDKFTRLATQRYLR